MSVNVKINGTTYAGTPTAHRGVPGSGVLEVDCADGVNGNFTLGLPEHPPTCGLSGKVVSDTYVNSIVANHPEPVKSYAKLASAPTVKVPIAKP